MANEIYNSSEWGLPIKYGWGDIYYNFYLRSSFSQRVIVDGGVAESINCIKI
jgi:hypothetical protein